MKRSTLTGFGAVAAVIAVVVGLSVVWPGLDAQQTPTPDTSVWVLQADGLQYGRVNTAIGELDTVRSVSNPSRIVETSEAAYVFTDSDSRMVRIDETQPVDLDSARLEDAAASPVGTQDVVTAGDFVAYRTDGGGVFAGRLSGGAVVGIDPRAGGEDDATAPYTADAITIDDRGVLFSYSSSRGTVLRYDVPSSSVRGEDELTAEVETPMLTSAGDNWVLVDAADGRFWRDRDEGARELGSSGTVTVSAADPHGDAVYAADATRLFRIPTGTDEAIPVFGNGTTTIGTPAPPVVKDGVAYAAWLPEGPGPGVLWNSETLESALDYGGLTLSEQRRPLFASSGDVTVLNDARSGWVWAVPEGDLIPSSQDWSLQEQVVGVSTPADEELPVVIDPKPPIAENDEFGVRPGSLTSLPVLLNDHDPNDDVLSIDPASVTGLDPAFGTITLTDDGQRLAVRVDPQASGTASFTYRVSDGTAADGLMSEHATVTLTVVDGSVNSAPAWCAVDNCVQEWPRPQLSAGSTITVPVLDAWVDPEGDPLYLLSAVDPTGAGSITAAPGGEVVYRLGEDTNTANLEDIPIELSVADAHGEVATRTLTLSVTPDPQPTLASFAVVDVVGSRVTIDISRYATGTGDISVIAARVLDDAAATATVVAGTTQFDFAAAESGTYRVSVTALVGGREATGIARITLLPEDTPADLSTSPVVAFVQPQTDATVDVLAAVTNPTGRVLLLSDIAIAAEPGANLSADTVAQRELRVSGGTNGGEPGPLGRVSYTVSDGTNDEGSRVRGEATVILLPPAPDTPPIARDDTIVVRAGTQVDIPVLVNDAAPSGGKPRLDPAAISWTGAGALAFGSGDVVRYLAPVEPGEYTIEYSAYTLGSPSMKDTASVRVQVLAADANRSPVPTNLSGRVLAGYSTTIPFDSFGVDPDGDAVRLESIVDQPDVGTASIAADGAGIVYTSVDGDSGQHTFRYRVVDEYGATGEATVHLGVLGGEANPSPVTYTDYVQVQAREDAVVRVHPLANDLDPTQGSLSLVSVVPDIPATTLEGTPSAEYAETAERIRSTNGDSVEITVGDQPTTMAFRYEAVSESGNTARGLIVVKAVRESVPDYPIVADTILVAEDRDEFVSGVDVLDGSVTWSSGDVADLDIALWGEPDDITVTGTRIAGSFGEQARIIPFEVTGEGPSGPITTYAFLRVPSSDSLFLSLRTGMDPVSVSEGEEVSFAVDSFVARAPGSVIEVGSVRASGGRADGSCRAASDTTAIYSAGLGAPWRDGCVVEVRLVGTTEWTYLTIPVAVTAIDPEPVLRAASLTINPGESVEYDLGSMTSWQGRSEWDAIRYELADSAGSFTVERTDRAVTLRARDSAVPGTEEFLTVSVSSHSGVTPAPLILRVGTPPSTLPRGGLTHQQCSKASGNECTITVTGTAGEINPFPSTPLEVVDVRPVGLCRGITFTVASASTVLATWTEDTAGTSCTASYSVKDAQGRVTRGDRDGALALDLYGFPAVPGALTQTSFGDGSLTLRVDPGDAAAAFPPVTKYEIREGSEVVAECSATGICPAISSVNGEQRTFEAYAINEVGPSRAAARTVAWAYDPPAAPTEITAQPVVTSGAGGRVSLLIAGIDAETTGSLVVSSPVGETVSTSVVPGATEVSLPSFVVGSNSATVVTVTAQSPFPQPPGVPMEPTRGAATIMTNGIGAPTGIALTVASQNTGGGRAQVTASASAVSGGTGSRTFYGFARDGAECRAESTSPTETFSGLQDGRLYTIVACAESRLGGDVFGRTEATQSVRAVQSAEPPSGYQFTVAPSPKYSDGRANWTIDRAPTSREAVPYENRIAWQGYPTTVFDKDPGITLRYEHNDGWWQSPWGTVTPAQGSAPYQVQAQWAIASCNGGSTIALSSSSSNGLAQITFDMTDAVYYDADGAALAVGEDAREVPATAVRVEGVAVKVSWAAQGWRLDDAAASLSAACVPDPETDSGEPLPGGSGQPLEPIDPVEPEDPADPAPEPPGDAVEVDGGTMATTVVVEAGADGGEERANE